MNYISSNNPIHRVGFKEAVYKGLAPDGGLFVPETIPVIGKSFRENLMSLEPHDNAHQLLYPFINQDLNHDQLVTIIQHAFQFEIPVKRIGDSDIHVLELFHGPTWAFKDVGARFLAGCLSAWSEGNEQVTILVATSGDTGGAVAHGFYRQPGTRVVVLYPSEKISPLQEMQIAGNGENIHAIAVEGNFDDCQRLVKIAFSDQELRAAVTLTSANSINIGRWLPQMVYYAYAFKKILETHIEPVICVPSGNYGNITAGMLLHLMGLRFKKFIAAHNENDTVPRFLENGIYEPHDTISTLANAMDVSDPGNFVRLNYLWQQGGTDLKSRFSAQSVSNPEILEAIKSCWEEQHYLLDPHTATAWNALNQDGGKGIILSTAHPFKFQDVIISALGFYPEEWKKEWREVEVKKKVIKVDYKILRKILSES